MVRTSPARRYRDCTGVRDIFQHDLEAAWKHLRLARDCRVGQSPVPCSHRAPVSTSLQCVLRSDVARLYRRISKRLAVETTSLYCSCFITPSHHSCSLAWPDPRRKREGLATPDYRSCSSLLKSTHAISIDFAEMHADRELRLAPQ